MSPNFSQFVVLGSSKSLVIPSLLVNGVSNTHYPPKFSSYHEKFVGVDGQKRLKKIILKMTTSLMLPILLIHFVAADFTTHGGSHLYGLWCPSADSLDSMDHFCTFDVSKIIPKNMHYFLHATFKPILGYDPQTRVHWDVCKRPNIFGVFLNVDLSHLSLGLPYALRSLRFDLPLPHWSTI